MHPQKDLEGKRVQLKKNLSEMKALLEWQKLKVFENTQYPSRQLCFSDDSAQQLSSHHARFLSLSIEVEEILKTHPHFARRSFLLKEIKKLHCQLYYLGTNVRVY